MSIELRIYDAPGNEPGEYEVLCREESPYMEACLYRWLALNRDAWHGTATVNFKNEYVDRLLSDLPWIKDLRGGNK